MQVFASGPLAFWYLQTAGSPLGIFGSMLPMLAIVAIFYLLVFMPMQKQKKQQQAMLDSLAAGQEVVTSGGIIGTIVNVSKDSLVLRVRPDNLKLQVARSAITSVVTATTAELEKK
ncbi:MAG: preprotein translocase subunit YajC [Acidobacteriota bacterium]